MLIEYTGIADRRTISKSDFKQHGFEHEAVDFNTAETHIIEVTDEVGKWLVKVDPDFKEPTEAAREGAVVRRFVPEEAPKPKTEPPKK